MWNELTEQIQERYYERVDNRTEGNEMTVTAKVFRVAGTTDDVTTCDQCGKDDLRHTVVMVHLDADGNDDGVSYMGSDCAARAAGWTQARIRKLANAADRATKEQAERERLAKQAEERAKFEKDFAAWLVATYGGTEKDVMKRLGLRTRFKLVVEFRDSE
jgi:hypothetical protein